jgi:hypothetical protein
MEQGIRTSAAGDASVKQIWSHREMRSASPAVRPPSSSARLRRLGSGGSNRWSSIDRGARSRSSFQSQCSRSVSSPRYTHPGRGVRGPPPFFEERAQLTNTPPTEAPAPHEGTCVKIWRG